MRVKGTAGVTLVELLVTISILGIISVAAAALLSTALQAHETGTDRSNLYRQGLFAMDRMTESVRASTYVLIPNAHGATRDILAVSGFTNDDNDFYFDDVLFPRIDEDPPGDMTADNARGIEGVDDDGDGSTDEGGGSSSTPKLDDDEDGLDDEDPLDGIDNDGDGNVDEDTASDITGDGAPGIKNMDDDADGTVDEGSPSDDDEDGLQNEDPLNPVLYVFDAGTSTLQEIITESGSSIYLAENVSSFQVTYETPERILIQLTLTGEKGESVAFSEYAYPRNVLQRNGKRVR